MPVWVLTNNKLKIGQKHDQLNGLDRYVVEVEKKVPQSILAGIQNAKKWNLKHPNEPIKVPKSIKKWHAKVIIK